MNYKVMTHAGDSFEDVAKKAKHLAINKNTTAEFNFNGVVCLVNNTTNLDWLYRDYSNSCTMEWDVVGPNCLPEYEPEVQAEFERRTKTKKEKRAEQEAEYMAKEERERGAFNEKTKGVEIELSDIEYWNTWKAKNTDSYGAAIFEYAESWAKLMQVEMASGKKLIECAESASFQLGFLGITGFMYGAAVSILSKCWKYGEELRKWHNKEYKHDGEGVVNPALLTLKTPTV